MKHDQEHAELVALYALQALPPDERALAGAWLAACVDCRQELEALRSLVGAFAAWPTDMLRPADSLWDRLAERIEAETGRATPPPVEPAPPRPEWKEAGPGISYMRLATDHERNRITMLVRLAPGADYPPHRHADLEELYLLGGELRVDERTLSPGDYLSSEPGTVDHRVWSESGCMCVLTTSLADGIL